MIEFPATNIARDMVGKRLVSTVRLASGVYETGAFSKSFRKQYACKTAMTEQDALVNHRAVLEDMRTACA